MAQSYVDVANLALSGLTGDEMIVSIDEGSRLANMVNRHLFPAVRSVLQGAPWSAALANLPLVEVAEEHPEWGAGYALPAQFVRPARLIDRSRAESRSPRYRLMLTADGLSRLLFTNLPSPWLEYVVLPQSPVAWPQYLVDAVAAELAARLAYPITKNRGVYNDFRTMAAMALSVARAADGNEQVEVMDAEAPWIDARGATLDRRHDDGWPY
ncbi:MAG: hypothetical protein AAF844_00175 [Pseudomonadota bacterium]